MDDREPFIARWSRRKLEAKDNPPAAMPPAGLPAAAPGAPPAAQSQAPESAQAMSAEYREFFDPRVDEKLRRTALRELFNEPHFNVMDGLDTYIDDYSKPDPIPDAMLRQLNQAKELFLFDDEKKAAESAGAEAAAAAGAPALPVAGADTSALPPSAAPGASDEDAGVATSESALAPAEGSRND